MKTEIGIIVEDGFDLDEFNKRANVFVQLGRVTIGSIVLDETAYADLKKVVEHFALEPVGDITMWNNAALGQLKVKKLEKGL